MQSELLRVKSTISEYMIPSDGALFQKTITEMCKPFKKLGITKVMAIDMKGLLYGPAIAFKLKVPFVPILKGGKIHNREKVVVQSFVDYSKKEKSIEIFKVGVSSGDRVLLVDDWFESGNTGRAAISLIKSLGGRVVGISVVINQLKSEDEVFLSKFNYHFLIRRVPKDR